MKVVSPSRLTSALVLSVCAAVFAQDQLQPPAETQPTPTQPASPAGQLAARRAALAEPRTGPGLLNEWLRKQDPQNFDWDLGGQVRGRYESKDGFAISGVPGSVDFLGGGADARNSYELLRTKFHLGYRQNEGTSYYLEARDSRTWNDERRPEPEEDTFELHQAYGVFGDLTRYPATLKVGRQELSYGDERLIGASDWSNLGRVFDAAKLHYTGNGYWVDFFAARPVLADEGSFNRWNDYDTLYGMYASSISLIQRVESQSYILYRNTTGNSPTANSGGSPQSGGPSARDIITVGARVTSVPSEFGGWDFESEVANQYGTINIGGRRVEQLAYAAHISGSYTWRNLYATPKISLEYNYSTGDGSPNDNSNETFDNLFPTNHKFYGMMDFFSWQNLHNPALHFACKPFKGLSISLSYQAFWLADTGDSFYTASGTRRGPAAATPGGGYGLNRSYDNYVGSEVDAFISYNITGWANVQAGYGHFFTGSYVDQSLRGVGGAKDADFFYLQARVSF